MKRPELKPGYIAMIIVLIMAAVILAIFLTDAGHNRREANIVLPDQTTADPSGGDVDLPYEESISGERIEITTENVLSVIAAIKRPTIYYLEMETTVYAGELSRTTQIRHWVSPTQSVTRRLTDGDAEALFVMRSGDEVRIWYEGSEDAYSGASTQSTDDIAGIPTYEDVLTSTGGILAAKYMMDHDRACIFVSVEDVTLGYVVNSYIDVDTGLLVRSQTYKGSELVYEMSVSIVDEDASGMDRVFE